MSEENDKDKKYIIFNKPNPKFENLQKYVTSNKPHKIITKECIFYFENKILHRDDGPAIITKTKGKMIEEWYINGIKYNRSEGIKIVNLIKKADKKIHRKFYDLWRKYYIKEKNIREEVKEINEIFKKLIDKEIRKKRKIKKINKEEKEKKKRRILNEKE